MSSPIEQCPRERRPAAEDMATSAEVGRPVLRRGSSGKGAFVRALLAVSHALLAVTARSLANLEGNVTPNQYQALVILDGRQPPACIADLAHLLDVTASTASRTVEQLVRRGLVTRTSPDSDRRRTTIELTASGLDVLTAVRGHQAVELQRILASAPECRHPEMISTLRAFAEAAELIPAFEQKDNRRTRAASRPDGRD